MGGNSVLSSRYPGFYWKRFLENSPRLFLPHHGGLGVWLVSEVQDGKRADRCTQDYQRLEKLDLHDLVGLDALLDRVALRKRTHSMVFYIFRQQHSWARFGFSKEICQRVLEGNDVFDPFLDCLGSFGYRYREDIRNWDGLYFKTLPNPELCYSFRYYEKNGRTSGNPWSLRRTAIYQKYDEKRGLWICILIQPSASFLSHLETEFLQRVKCGTRCTQQLLILHGSYLNLGLSFFGEYQDGVHSEVVQLSNKASFSAVGRQTKSDFVVTFQDLQKLQLLKQKLLRASNVLKATLSVVTKLQRYYLTEAAAFNLSVEQGGLDELHNCRSLIDIYNRNVALLLKFAEDAQILLSRVLDTRREEVLLETNAAMQANLDVMKRIAFLNGEENQKLSKITKETSKDSRAVKALTTIATMYLPASLIATIFSSNLVHIPLQNDEATYGRFAVVKEFWIYVLVTLLLTLITVALLLLPRKRWKSSFPPSQIHVACP